MSKTTRERKTTNQLCAMLAEKFKQNKRMLEKSVWQNEKDFPLCVPSQKFTRRVQSLIS